MKTSQTPQDIYSEMYANDTILIERSNGSGKASVVQQFAKENGLHLVTLFLHQHDIHDTFGMPYIADSVNTIQWAQPIWLNDIMEKAKEGIRSIIMIDDLNCIASDGYELMSQLVNARRIHEHELPTVDGSSTMIVGLFNSDDHYINTDVLSFFNK